MATTLEAGYHDLELGDKVYALNDFDVEFVGSVVQVDDHLVILWNSGGGPVNTWGYADTFRLISLEDEKPYRVERMGWDLEVPA